MGDRQAPSASSMEPAGEDIAGQIAARVRELLGAAAPLCAAHRARLPHPRVRLDLRGRVAGQAIWHVGGRTELRFNTDIAQRHRDHFLRHTVAHEVAHLVTVACFGRVRPHGPEWRSIMRHFGIQDPTRCHDYTLDEAGLQRQRRWDYACACMRHQLSTTRHNRVQRNRTSYHCRRCGTPLRRAGPDGD